MSNKVYIQPTIFENYPSVEKSYGYRIWDDEGMEYCNHWTKEDLDAKPLDILRHVSREASPQVDAMLSFVLNNEHGIYIRDDWYNCEDIQNILDTY